MLLNSINGLYFNYMHNKTKLYCHARGSVGLYLSQILASSSQR